MSLAIVTTTNEGNILAADSMETYRNALGDTREGSMTRMKLFQLNKRVGAVSCGLAFLDNKNIHQQMMLFKKQHNLDNLPVADVVDKLYDFFYEKYQDYIQQAAKRKQESLGKRGRTNIETSIKLEVITAKFKDIHGPREKKYYMPIIEILVAGHDPDGTNHVYKITIPDPKDKNGIIEKSKAGQPGATWIGQTEVLVRIIRGWSPQIKRSKQIEEMPEKAKNELLKHIDDQEYLVNWGTMTFQDAIEFAELAIKTTESIQRMTDGTWQLPGASPGVGGPIDIAIITPEKGFMWIKKKKIITDEGDVDLDALPDLTLTPVTPKKKT